MRSNKKPFNNAEHTAPEGKHASTQGESYWGQACFNTRKLEKLLSITLTCFSVTKPLFLQKGFCCLDLSFVCCIQQGHTCKVIHIHHYHRIGFDLNRKAGSHITSFKGLYPMAVFYSVCIYLNSCLHKTDQTIWTVLLQAQVLLNYVFQSICRKRIITMRLSRNAQDGEEHGQPVLFAETAKPGRCYGNLITLLKLHFSSFIKGVGSS